MRKGTGEFKKVEITKLICDECGQEITNLLDQIHWSSRYSDGYDCWYGDEFDFCSISCMLNHSDRPHGEMFPPIQEDVNISIPSKYIREMIFKLRE